MKPEEFQDPVSMIVGAWVTFTDLLNAFGKLFSTVAFLWHIIRLVSTMPDEDKCGSDTFLCFTCVCFFIFSDGRYHAD